MSIKPRRNSRHRQRGVTLIELIMFIMIVGVALTAIISVMNLTTQRSADPVRRKQALMLAEAYLEEVEQAKFSFCDVFDANAGEENPADPNVANCAGAPENWGAEVNNARPFDNVNDYVAAPNTAVQTFGANGNLTDANGTALALSGFEVSVTIAPATLGDGTAANTIGVASTATNAPANTEVLRITVTVNYDGQSLSLDGFRTRYAPNTL